MAFLDLPLGRVHYGEHGGGIPLVLLHANPGDSRDFDAVLPALAQTHRVLALDWPGYGLSEPLAQPASATVSTLYEVLRAFLAALSLPPALFIGNSVGGHLAARLAIEHGERVRGLVLVAPGGFTPHNLVTRGFCRFQGSRWSLSPRRFAGLYLKQRTATTQAMLERAATTQATPECLALNRALWRSFADPENDLRLRATTIRAPTLLLFGQKDPAIPAARDGRVAARCLPSARYGALPCGHASFAELPQAFLDEVQPFLAAAAAQR